MILVAAHGGVTFMNEAAGRLLDLPPFDASTPPPLPEGLVDLIQAAHHHPDGRASSELQLAITPGLKRTVNADVTQLPLQPPEKLTLITLWGLVDHKHLESRIRHLERLSRLGVMSAGLAHELRNSLVALRTMTDLFLEQQPGNELAQTVRREMDRANTIAVRMLSYSKPNAQVRRPVSTHQILDRALQLASPRFKEAGATLTTSLRANPDVVAADEAHMEQMFLNLLINAADAITPDGSVTLSTETCEQSNTQPAVRVAVCDTGSGIAPDVLPNLFQPFYTTKRHGTGLGLYLAQRIINEHAGTIQVQSAPGQGTRVEVTLPIHAG